MRTNEEIRNESGYDFDCNTEALCNLQNLTRLDVLTTMENLALWKGGNTAEEKIQHFFKVLQMAKDELA